jgi:hypothetical protein
MSAQRRGGRREPDSDTGARLFVKPGREGLVARDLDRPDREPIPAEGKEVADTSCWRRRIACGDVVLADAPRK